MRGIYTIAVLALFVLCAQAVAIRKEKRDVVGHYAASRDHPIWDIIHISATKAQKEDTIYEVMSKWSPQEIEATEQFFHKHLSQNPEYSYEEHLNLISNLDTSLHPNNMKAARHAKRSGSKPSAKYLTEAQAKPFAYKDYKTHTDSADYICNTLADDKGMKATAGIKFGLQVIELVAGTICKSLPQCIMIIPVLIEIPLNVLLIVPCTAEFIAKVVVEVTDMALYMIDFCVVYRPIKHMDAIGKTIAVDNYNLMAQVTKWRMEATLARNIRSPFMARIYGGLLSEVDALVTQSVESYGKGNPGGLDAATSAFAEAEGMEEGFDKAKLMSQAYNGYAAAYRVLVQTEKAKYMSRG